MLLIQYLVLLTVTYLVLVTGAQMRNSFDEKTGNLKLYKKIWEEKSPKRKDTNTSGMEAPNLEGWEGRRRLARSKRENMNTSRIVDISKWELGRNKRETRLNTNTSRIVDISKWELGRNKRETHLNTNTSRFGDISKWERWEGRRRDKKERMEAQKIERCLLQG